MWIVETPPDENRVFHPVNLDHVAYIDKDSKTESFAIKFVLDYGTGTNTSSQWIKWWFSQEHVRDEWLEKLKQKLPRLDFGINDITL